MGYAWNSESIDRNQVLNNVVSEDDMKIQKKRIRYTDNAIPILATKATKDAYKKSMRSGNGVVIRKDNKMVRVNRNGTVSEIKFLPPLIAVKKGSRYTIND